MMWRDRQGFSIIILLIIVSSLFILVPLSVDLLMSFWVSYTENTIMLDLEREFDRVFERLREDYDAASYASLAADKKLELTRPDGRRIVYEATGQGLVRTEQHQSTEGRELISLHLRIEEAEILGRGLLIRVTVAQRSQRRWLRIERSIFFAGRIPCAV